MSFQSVTVDFSGAAGLIAEHAKSELRVVIQFIVGCRRMDFK